MINYINSLVKKPVLFSNFLVLLGLLMMTGCSALQQAAALRDVKFDLDRVGAVELAGVDITRFRSYEDLGFVDLGRLTAAITSGSLPLSFNLYVRAENPADNSVPARLIGLDWTLFLQDKKTVSGKINEEIVLEPGAPQEIPVNINLDLVEFFDSGVKDLINLGLALSGEGTPAQEIKLQAVPTIQTPLGPIRYPQPLTIVSRKVGG